MYLDQVGETYLKDIARAVETDPGILQKHKKALLRTGMITCREEKIYVIAQLTPEARRVLDRCLYPLYAATQSSTDLQTWLELGHLLYDPGLGKEIMSKAFASHTLKSKSDR
jgi:DNA-binding MarR family transcriptional regulator